MTSPELESGLIEFLAQFLTSERLNRFETVLEQRTRFMTVVLEDTYQIYNASACMRSCECFGIQDIHLIERQNPFQINDEVSVGSGQWLTLHQYSEAEDNTLACLNQLKAEGYRLIGTAANSERALVLDEVPLDAPLALVFGTEFVGMSEQAIATVDDLLTIPMCGFTDCLNLSVTVALCIQQLTARMRASGVNWELDELEMAQLRAEWVRKSLGYRLPVLESEYYRRQGNSEPFPD